MYLFPELHHVTTTTQRDLFGALWPADAQAGWVRGQLYDWEGIYFCFALEVLGPFCHDTM